MKLEIILLLECSSQFCQNFQSFGGKGCLIGCVLEWLKLNRRVKIVSVIWIVWLIKKNRMENHHVWFIRIKIVLFVWQERATERRIEASSSQGLPNWGWQMHGQVTATPMPLFSTAASSGFSSSATTAPSAAILSSKPPNTTSHSICFASSASAVTHPSQYYFQMKPPPP